MNSAEVTESQSISGDNLRILDATMERIYAFFPLLDPDVEGTTQGYFAWTDETHVRMFEASYMLLQNKLRKIGAVQEDSLPLFSKRMAVIQAILDYNYGDTIPLRYYVAKALGYITEPFKRGEK